MINNSYLKKKKNKAMNSVFREKLVNLDTSHGVELKRLEQKISDIESEKCGLKEELNSRLEEKENLFKKERSSLSNLITTTSEGKVEAENRLIEMEEQFKLEKCRLMKEIETKLNENKEKEKELESLRAEMEEKYKKERAELEEKCNAEIKDLKERLAISEMEQGRLKEETLEVERKLKETEKNLFDSELEQFRVNYLKVEVESRLQCEIVDLTQEKTNKAEAMRQLEQQLAEKEQAEERLKKELEDLEEELQCSICAELFIEPTVLSCGHMFCKVCIEEWKGKKKICPMCRTKITTCVRLFTMDSIIDKNVELLSTEAKVRRANTIEERKGDQRGIPAKKRKHRIPHRYNRESPTLPYPYVDLRGAEISPGGYRTLALPSTSTALPHTSSTTNQPAPSTSRSGLITPNTPVVLGNTFPQELSDPDPFAWVAQDNTFRMEDIVRPLASPVTIAAIDLTNFNDLTDAARPAATEPRAPRTRSATATIVSAADTTIDLTSP